MKQVLPMIFLVVNCSLAGSFTTLPGTAGLVGGCLKDTNGRPAVGVLVTFTVPPPGCKSGYHMHDTCIGNTRPNIVINHSAGVTGADGCAYTDSFLPLFAGVYTVIVSGSGMTDRAVITASVAGMSPLSFVTGMAPLSTYQDAGHGNIFMGQSGTTSKAMGIANAWHMSTYDLVYGGMTFIRMSLQWGGDLDNNTPYWAPNSDGHGSGKHWDMKNPSTTNPVARQQMTNAIDLFCGTGHTIPIGGGTVATAPTWHIICY